MPPPPPEPRVTAMLLPFALVVFLGYAAVGVPLSTLPVQVASLGHGTATVGAIIGLSAAVTLLTRQLAGRGPDGVVGALHLTAVAK